MKANKKIITDRPTISDSEIIELKKSFKDILQNYYSGATSSVSGGLSSGLSWGIGGLSILAIAAISYFAVISLLDNSDESIAVEVIADSLQQTHQDTIVVAKRKIDPPFGEIIEFENFNIDNSKKQKITTKNGTVINIPKNAFVDINGDIVTEDIAIDFRDFYNPMDFYLSGIPMDYDSVGVNYTFTSAGMFQIDAQSNGKQLYLKEGKKIDIELVSNYEETYNFYQYDTLKNEWEYMSTEDESDISKVVSQEENISETDSIDYSGDYAYNYEENYEVASEDIVIEERIVQLVEKKYMRVGEIENYAFPASEEIVKGTEFENIDSLNLEIKQGQDFSVSYYSVVWDKIYLEGTSGDLSLNLKKGDKLLSFSIIPVINEEKFEQAKEELERVTTLENKRRADNKERINNATKLSKAIDDWKYTRNIQIVDLGFYNCDRPMPSPPLPVLAENRIIDSNGERLRFNTINVVQHGQNILWNYNNLKWYHSNPKKYFNIAWFKTKDDKLAIILPDRFTLENDYQYVAMVYDTDEGLEVLTKLLN